MADRWAVATGNWSSTATWNGGTLPTSSDDVFADGFTVTIDQNITVLSIRTTQRSGGTAGGGFSVSGTRTINANVTAGTTDCLTVSAVSSDITVNGNITGGTVSSRVGLRCAQNSCTVTITGNVQGGTIASTHGVVLAGNTTNVYTVVGNATSGNGSFGVNHSAGTLTFTGDMIGSTGATAVVMGGVGGTATGTCNTPRAFGSSAPCVLNLTADVVGSGTNSTTANIQISAPSALITGGNISGGGSSNRFALVINNGFTKFVGNASASSSSPAILQSGGVLYIVGNVTGTLTQAAVSTASTTIVIGNVTGGTTGDGINSTSSTLLLVHGTVTGGSSAGGHGISHSGSADIRIFGTEVAGAGDAAVNNTGSGSKTTTAVGGGGGGSVRFVNTRGGADQ